MSLAQRFERRLESVVGSAFARVFKGQVEPVEIATALQREATDKRNVMGTGEVLAPNRYRVTLSPSDYERLVPWEAQLTNSLAELVQEHLDQNGWRTIGDIEVYLARDDALHTGVFGVASRMESNAPASAPAVRFAVVAGRPRPAPRCVPAATGPRRNAADGCPGAWPGTRAGRADARDATARSAGRHAARTAARRPQRLAAARRVPSTARRRQRPRLGGRRRRRHEPSLRSAGGAQLDRARHRR
jgi:hypothetical protein